MTDNNPYDEAALERMTTLMMDKDALRERERAFAASEHDGLANQIETTKEED